MSNIAVQGLKTDTPAADTHAPWEVDGRESFDLRPVVAAIMKAENWILDRLAPGQKLFLIMGELHNNHMDLLLQQAVLHAHLRQAGKKKDRTFSLGLEFPRNFLFERTGKQDADPDGIHGMNAVIANPARIAAPEAQSAVLRTCLENGISVSFNDVAYDLDTGHLRLDHPYTEDLIRRYKHLLHGTPPDAINRGRSSVGPSFSNLAMMEGNIAHAKTKESKIQILHTGKLHVAGSTHHNWWYSTSLSKLFLDSGHAILPIMNNYENCGYYLSPEARGMMDSTGVKISDLPLALARNGIQGGFHYMEYEEARAEVNRYSCYDL